MTFHKTVELTAITCEYLQSEILTFNRGQWVSMTGAKGRFMGNKGGIITILWRYKTEPFYEYNLRFKRACQGYKVSRPARFTFLKTDTATPTPYKLQQQDAFLFELTNVRVYDAPDDQDDPFSDDESEHYVTRASGWQEGYRLLMQCRSALLIQSEVTGRKSIVLRDSEKARSLLIYPSRTTYAGYPSGWGSECH